MNFLELYSALEKACVELLLKNHQRPLTGRPVEPPVVGFLRNHQRPLTNCAACLTPGILIYSSSI